jgi:GT2 family glycosyltransferase
MQPGLQPGLRAAASEARIVNDELCDVVIATRNRPDALRRSLEGLLRQTFTDFGVIVVDDCSDVPIRPVVDDERFGALKTTVIELPNQRGPAAGRNAGVAASNARYVVFIDDDVVPDSRLIEVHLAAVQRTVDATRPIVSCGPFVQPADWGDPTPWNLWEAKQAKKEADAMTHGLYEPTWRQFHTGNNCLPVEAFRAVGGFDEDFKRAEDDEFALRLEQHGCTFVFEPSAIGWHYSRRSLEAWLLIPRAYAYFDVMIDRLHPGTNYLRQKKIELRKRRLPMRLVRKLVRGKRSTAFGVKRLVELAQKAHRRGGEKLAMAALSIAYDLSYVQSLREAEAGESEFGTVRQGPKPS